MAYTDRPPAGQRGSYARDSRLITIIRRPAGPSLSISLGNVQQKNRLVRPGLLTLVIATKERK